MKLEARARICHVVVLGQLDGAQRSMLEICERLDRSRFEVHAICQSRGPLTEALADRGIRFHLAPSLARSIRPVGDLRAAWQLLRLLRAIEPDLVHTHTSKGGFLGRMAARATGVGAIVHHVRGLPFHERSPAWRRRLFRRLEQLAGAACDRVLFVNHEERRLAIDEGWLPAEKCSTVYNGIDVERYDPRATAEIRHEFRQRIGAGEDEVLILFSGRLDRQKQPLILPEILRCLEARCPAERWRLVIAGEGPAAPELDRRLARRAPPGRYLRLGWCQDPLPATAGCDVSLLPSLWEGLPRVLLEASAAGLPIVSSDVKGNREVVTPETGVLCPADDAAGFAEALAGLFDRERRRRLGEAARRRAAELFRVEATFAAVLATYEELLARSETIR